MVLRKEEEFWHTVIGFIEENGWSFDGGLEMEKSSGCVSDTSPDMTVEAFEKTFLGFVERNGWSFEGSIKIYEPGVAEEFQYSFSNMLDDLKVGRKIEFEYNGKLYGIFNGEVNWFFFADNCDEMLCHNEALAVGMEDISEQLLEPGFDRNKPDVFLWSDIIDAQSQLDDDFAIWPLDSSTEDIYTEKLYRVYLEWDYTKGRAEKVIQYIREHLEHTSEVEIWHVWLGHGVCAKIRNCTIALDEFTSDDLKELSDLEVWKEPITHYCFTIKAK